jgi:hypothetical protein
MAWFREMLSDGRFSALWVPLQQLKDRSEFIVYWSCDSAN